MKISNLLNKDYKIIEKKKIFFIIPICIMAVAAICMIIYNFVLGSPLNLGMDFTGGYTINVKLSTKLTDATYEDYKSQVVNIVENLTDDEGNRYNIKISNVQRQGSGETASIYIKYKAVADQDKMENEVNVKLETAISEKIFIKLPSIKTESGKIILSYTDVIDTFFFNNSVKEKISTALNDSSVSFTSINLVDVDVDGETIYGKTIEIATSATVTNDQLNAIKSGGSIKDNYSGMAVKGDLISAAVSQELLVNAILAISLAIVLMLVYIAFRFEVSSGLSAIVALFHDIAIMFGFMAIFHLEINSTFIAALITILGYSINNTIIIFDRVRENFKSLFNKNTSAATIANRSIKETIWRSINTTLTTLITIGMVALIGVPDIRIFAIPIIIGLLSGTYSSICIAPSIWAMWKDRKGKKKFFPPEQTDTKNLTAKADPVTEQ